MLMQVNQRVRIINEIANAREAEAELAEEKITYLAPKKDSYNVDTLVWQMRFVGRQNTLLEGGQYEIEIRIPESYPGTAPECVFVDKFEHVHVYTDGKICLPMLDSKSWDPRVSIVDLAKVIINMLHSDPKPDNKANNKMAELYLKAMDKKNDLKALKQTEYGKIMVQQAMRLNRTSLLTKEQGEKDKKKNQI